MTPVTAMVQKRVPKALVIYGWAVVAYNVLVILWGAIVRTSGSGAGCGENWPLCNGDFVPHHPRLATIIEFAHRSMSGVATALVVGLLIWTFQATRRHDRARKAAVASIIFLVMEALLGAVLVLGGYVQNNVSTGRVVMQAIHFTNTMLLLASLTLTAWWLRDHRSSRSTSASALTDRRLTLPTWTALVATIVMGATGALAALADTLFPSTSFLAGFAADFSAGAPALVRIRWVHPAAAIVGFCCVIWLVMKMRTQLAWTVTSLLCLQFVLGIADVLLLAPTWLQIVHLLGADLYWIALVCLAAEALWSPAPAAAFADECCL